MGLRRDSFDAHSTLLLFRYADSALSTVNQEYDIVKPAAAPDACRRHLFHAQNTKVIHVPPHQQHRPSSEKPIDHIIDYSGALKHVLVEQVDLSAKAVSGGEARQQHEHSITPPSPRTVRATDDLWYT